MPGIPLDKAELLALFLESIIYGLSLPSGLERHHES